MSDLIVDGIDIEPFIPLRITASQKEQIAALTRDISAHINTRLPIVLSYNNRARIVSPHSLYLQHRHLPKTTPSTRVRESYPWDQKLHTDGARRTIATDTYQTAQEGPISRTGWRTFHLDKVDDRRLLTFEEVCEILLPDGTDPRPLENYLSTPFPRSPRFVKHYSHGVRLFLSQTDALPNQMPRVITK
jgi:hypothetical protein